ncbi:probable G-protein coupled receptor AH9.1 isoform X3 [Zootermopsis nevadensis]|uniref:probable G-protein coupled receptor AH9.1 isoform X3 n=1 Tax=Zootermopsis nevadensis TaxID=136037 RepID=UPI000B8EDCAE|nr:probable G-protein coupled receptor AH9.1 isoform X3 [Zootermopsis nevadensis]
MTEEVSDNDSESGEIDTSPYAYDELGIFHSCSTGYSAAALLAILFAIPFCLRLRIYKDSGRWNNLPQAFYHEHLELFLGNACLGVGVMMLLALTVERYISVCHPGRTQPLIGPPRLIVCLIPLLTFLIYLPNAFRYELRPCLLSPGGPLFYQREDNKRLLDSVIYSTYKVVLEVVFKVGPTVLLAALNMRIMIVYRRSCERRRRMILCRTSSSDDDPRTFAEERRLILLLGSTSILFLVCVSPMVILNVTLSQRNLSMYSYQVFRAVANLLEVTNYSMTFYIYCLFSEDFRNTLLRTFGWPWKRDAPTAFQDAHSAVVAKQLMATKLNATPTLTTASASNNNATVMCLPVVPNNTAQKLWKGFKRPIQGTCGYVHNGSASV